jgi:hypothetical protein
MTTDILPPPMFTARMVRELKGAPLSCFVLMLFAGMPVSNEWLCRMSGYTDKPISQALKLLSGPEYQIIRRSRGGWLLSKDFQLMLGSEESRKNSVPTTTTLINTNLLTDEVVVVSRKNSDFEEDESFLNNMQACKELGIGEPSASLISGMTHVTPEYIHAHITGLQKGETKGLAIIRMKNGEEPTAANPKSKKDAVIDDKLSKLRERAMRDEEEEE